MNSNCPRARRRWYSRFRIDVLSLGLVAFAGFLASLTQGNDRDRSEITAVALMQRAHDGRAVWKKFPGFRADIRVSVDGKQVTGSLNVSSKGEIELSMPDDESFAWVKVSLRSVVSHRMVDTDAIQGVAFADDQVAHPLGRLLKSASESDHSQWRIQNDVMTEVHREHGKTRFIISVTDVVRTDEGKHLPKTFDVTTWDTATGRIQSSRQVLNEWTRIGKFDLPTRLMAAISKEDGTRRVEQIELSRHELLPTADVSAIR